MPKRDDVGLLKNPPALDEMQQGRGGFRFFQFYHQVGLAGHSRGHLSQRRDGFPFAGIETL